MNKQQSLTLVMALAIIAAAAPAAMNNAAILPEAQADRDTKVKQYEPESGPYPGPFTSSCNKVDPSAYPSCKELKEQFGESSQKQAQRSCEELNNAQCKKYKE
jgi:hypothetical protein